MAITEKAKSVIERVLDPSRVKSRAGGQGMTFDYIGTEHAIQLLNEAFDYAWDSRVVEHEILADGSLAIALVEIKVWDEAGSPIVKQQFGSCNINRGVDPGAALKGAASDGLKKCASQLGVALELYLDDVPAAGGFKPPTAAPSRPSPAPGPAAAPPPTAPPVRPSAPSAPPARPAPPAAAPARPAPPAPPTAQAPPVAPPPVAPPPARPNPFSGQQGGGNTASVSKPSAPVVTPPARPAAPPPVAASAAAARPNPFGGNDSDKGITTVQMSALTSLAAKKGLSQPDLVALAQVVDSQGAPKQTFEELTHAEAIEVVKASQRQ